MSISFCVLGSGSGGNCTIVLLHKSDQTDHFILLDAGLSPRETAKRLGPLGIRLYQISDVLITHLDQDHLNRGWCSQKLCRSFNWHISRRHISEAFAAGLPANAVEPFDEDFQLSQETFVSTVALPHDDKATIGYRISHRGSEFGFSTDLGVVPQSLLEHFTNLDALAIESNYDRQMQLNSNRPSFLKKRIMGGLGHLSNEQSLEAVINLDKNSKLQHVVLLHLSRHCNDPQLVKRLYAHRCPNLLDRLTITSQYLPTPMLRIAASDRIIRTSHRPGQQLNFLEA